MSRWDASNGVRVAYVNIYDMWVPYDKRLKMLLKLKKSLNMKRLKRPLSIRPPHPMMGCALENIGNTPIYLECMCNRFWSFYRSRTCTCTAGTSLPRCTSTADYGKLSCGSEQSSTYEPTRYPPFLQPTPLTQSSCPWWVAMPIANCPRRLLGHWWAWSEWTISEETTRREITIKWIWKLWALI